MTPEVQIVLDLLRSDFQRRIIDVTVEADCENVLSILYSQKLLMHVYRMGRSKFPEN